jgi:HlyD family secretion protein
VFNGIITEVSSVPIPGRWPNMDLKEYEAEIKLTDGLDVIQKLRPGLTAQVEILVDSRENILQVPMTAVLALADKQVAFVLTNKGEERRDLEVGLSNQGHVEIKEGVKVGELVILNARSQFPDKIAAIETELKEAKAKRDATEKVPTIPVRPAPSTAPSAGAPGGATAGGPPGGGRGPGGGGDRGAIFAGMDKNSDGKLAGDEISEQMQSRVADLDNDKDGAISKEEFMSAPRGNRGGGGGAPGGGGGRGGAPGGN